MTTTCGWCLTGDHAHCKKGGSYYDKTWTCSCKECSHPTEEGKARGNQGRGRKVAPSSDSQVRGVSSAGA